MKPLNIYNFLLKKARNSLELCNLSSRNHGIHTIVSFFVRLDDSQEMMVAIQPASIKLNSPVKRVLAPSEDQITESQKGGIERGSIPYSTLFHICLPVFEKYSRPHAKVISSAFMTGLTTFAAIFEVS